MGALTRSYYPLCRTRLGHRMARRIVKVARRLARFERFRLPLDALDLDHDALAGLIHLWDTTHWADGDGMMPSNELLALYRLAATWPIDGDIVELGSWIGHTTCYLATACRVRGRGRVHAVDTFAGHKEGDTQYDAIGRYQGSTLETFDRRVAHSDLNRWVDRYVGFTCDVAGRYTGDAIRVLFIDADHSYEGVRSDFEMWSPLVADGGVIVFHDYLMPEVARFVDLNVFTDERFVASPGVVLPNVAAVTKKPAMS